VLKAVTGAAAYDPNVFCSRMAISDEIVVCRVLVLAHAVFK